MDLKNLNITLGQLLQEPKAKKILSREFPTMINSPMVRLYSSMPLRRIIGYSKGVVSQEKIRAIIKELEMI